MTMVVDGRQREAITSAVDAAFSCLSDRMRAHGGAFAPLADAMRRAGSGGKQLRPLLVVRSFEALDGDPDLCPALMPTAAAFELLHTAFVIHDDVIDADTVRRGVPNVAGEFRLRADDAGASPAGSAALGDAAAILAGDLLLHEAHRLIARAVAPDGVRLRLLDLLDDAVLVSAAGELADVEQAILDRDPIFDETLSTSTDKTAVYSFSAPLRAGAALAGADDAVGDALGACGTRLGLAFQLVDDLIGAFGTPAQAGRAAGTDLAAAKRTPLVALARDTGSWPVVSGALALAHTGTIAVQEAQRALDASGARSRLEHHIRELLDDTVVQARATLPADVADLVDDLAVHVQERIP